MAYVSPRRVNRRNKSEALGGEPGPIRHSTLPLGGSETSFSEFPGRVLETRWLCHHPPRMLVPRIRPSQSSLYHTSYWVEIFFAPGPNVFQALDRS